jgi:hypothetical protein
MPWTGPEFRSHHNRSLSDPQAAHAARVANAIMRSGQPEGIAIATANKLAERTSHAGGGVAGFTPHIMPPHLMGGRPQGMKMPHFTVPHIGTSAHGGGHRGVGTTHIGIPRAGFAFGGMGISPSEAEPWWTRSEARGEEEVHPGGLVASATSGRGDHVPTAVAADSYVLPADVVAGLGQHNTLNGAAVIDKMMNSLPYGIEPARFRGRGETIPHPQARPPAPRYAEGGRFDNHVAGFAEGRVPHGASGEPIPVRLSGGEYVVLPRFVLAIGRGNMDRGHAILDALVKKLRAKFVKEVKSLPGPKRD